MRIGIDLGGTKIEAIALSAKGTTLARRRIDTPCGDYPGILAAIAALVAAVEVETGTRGSIGVGTERQLLQRGERLPEQEPWASMPNTGTW